MKEQYCKIIIFRGEKRIFSREKVESPDFSMDFPGGGGKYLIVFSDFPRAQQPGQ